MTPRRTLANGVAAGAVRPPRPPPEAHGVERTTEPLQSSTNGGAAAAERLPRPPLQARGVEGIRSVLHRTRLRATQATTAPLPAAATPLPPPPQAAAELATTVATAAAASVRKTAEADEEAVASSHESLDGDCSVMRQSLRPSHRSASAASPALDEQGDIGLSLSSRRYLRTLTAEILAVWDEQIKEDVRKEVAAWEHRHAEALLEETAAFGDL